jgi:hypothetical protein
MPQAGTHGRYPLGYDRHIVKIDLSGYSAHELVVTS